MVSEAKGALLGWADPPPVNVENPQGGSPFLLLGDHAGAAIPESLGTLGLAETDRWRHIAWDIGVRTLGSCLAERLDATFIHQRYSRLVADCNRDPQAADVMPSFSDGSVVPGNCGLSAAAAAERLERIHEPYHSAIAAEIRRLRSAGRSVILVSLHSFTPTMNGTPRPWQVGILHDRGTCALAHFLLDRLQAVPGLCVGDNEPYRMDEIDYTIPRHAYPEAIDYAEIEIRQDLIADLAGAERFAALIGDLLKRYPSNGA